MRGQPPTPNKFIFHGQHTAPTQPSKVFFLLTILAALIVTVWLGLDSPGDAARQVLLLACLGVFMLRTAFMVVYLLPRRMGWREVVGDALVVWLVAYGLGVYWASSSASLGWSDSAALVLFAAGSVLTTGSELARKRWKDRPGHERQLYTSGAFRYAQHINYFGEVVSFAGLSMITRTWWAAVVPVGMLLFFLFLHMPALDRHLRQRYSAAFDEYRCRTSKLIPFIY